MLGNFRTFLVPCADQWRELGLASHEIGTNFTQRRTATACVSRCFHGDNWNEPQLACAMH